MKTPKRKALNSTQGQTKASSEDTSSPQEMPESIYIEYIDGLIGQYGTGDSALMSEIETIRNNPKLLKIYNAQRALLVSRFSHSRSFSNEAKTELFGPDLSGPAPPMAVKALNPQPSTALPKTIVMIPGAESWADVSLKFVGEDAVRVMIKRKYVGRFHFASLGLENKRGGSETKPNRYWAMLQLAASYDGLFRYQNQKTRQRRTADADGLSERMGKDDKFNAAHQSIKRLQTELKRIFGLPDAFKDWNGQGWEARFIITSGSSEDAN